MADSGAHIREEIDEIVKIQAQHTPDAICNVCFGTHARPYSRILNGLKIEGCVAKCHDAYCHTSYADTRFLKQAKASFKTAGYNRLTGCAAIAKATKP